MSRRTRKHASQSIIAEQAAQASRDSRLIAAVSPVFEHLERRRLLNGALDNTFGTAGKATTDFGGVESGNAIAVLDDGRFVVVGSSGSSFAVARYNADGTLDTTFDGDGKATTVVGSLATAYSVAIQTDGRIVVGGYAVNGPSEDFAVVRYNTDGTLDTNFDGDGIATVDFAGRSDRVYAVQVQTDGSIVAAGYATTGPAATNQDFGVARLTSTGALDTGFNTTGKVTTNFGGVDSIYSMVLDGTKLVTAGTSAGNFALARYNSGGSLDTSFNVIGRVTSSFVAGAASANGLAIDGSGKYVAAGGAGNDFAVARYTTAGLLDSGFGTGGQVTIDFASDFDVAQAVEVQTNGDIVAAGSATVGGNASFAVARLESNGSLDTNGFGSGTGKVTTNFSAGDDAGGGMVLQSDDGKVLVAGTRGSTDDFAVARYEVNNAPVLVTTSTSIPTINEDDVSNSGQSVSAFLAGLTITDPDAGAVTGIAVTAVDDSNGTWEYSTNSGGLWSPISPVTGSSSLVLSDSGANRIRFVPDTDFNTDIGPAPTFTFRAWDQYPSGAISGTKVDTTNNGGFHAFSTATGTASITVTADNDAPVNNVPFAQQVSTNGTLTFSVANTNAISISDVDVASDDVQVAMSVLHGKVTLSTLAGLTVDSGANGTAAITVTGTLAAINAALAGMTYQPNTGYDGGETLTLVTSDLGNNPPPAETDTDNVSITVNPLTNTVYANDSWSITTDVGPTGLSYGDTVQDGANGPFTFGIDAFSTIQNAHNFVTPSGTVHVLAGAYNEDVSISKTISLLGEGYATTTISGPIGGAGSTIQVGAGGVLIDGFTITRDGNNPTDWNSALNTAGIAVQGQTNSAEIRNNKFYGNRTGIDINNSNGNDIHNNIIDDNRTGLIFRNQTDNTAVEENQITNNWTVGLLFLDGSGGSNTPPQQALNSSFSNNNFSGNWYGQIVDRQSGGSLPSPGTNLKNFSGNWFGTTSPIITTANTTEPGYAAQIPVAYGGSAVPPGGQPDIAGPASANFDITPLLDTGTDTNVETQLGRGTVGFQGSYATLNVTAAGAQTGSTGRIQEALDYTASNDIKLKPGAYVESDITVDKAANIHGTGANNTDAMISPAVADSHSGSLFSGGAHSAIILQSSNVTISNLTIDGGANADYRGGVVTDYNAGGPFNNITVSNTQIANTFDLGVFLDGGFGTQSTGHVISGNTLTAIGGHTSNTGVLLIQASASITGNSFDDIETGIGTNYIDSPSLAPLVNISNNDLVNVTFGMNLSGLAGGSIIGGPLVSDGNDVDLTVSGVNDVGITVQYATGVVTVQNNVIDAVGADSGIWVYQTTSNANRAQIAENTITATASSIGSAGEGTGVFVTDDNSLFSEGSPGTSYATLVGNTITGFMVGVDANSAAAGTVNVTVGGATVADDNDISANTIGIRASGGATLTVQNNDSSISGNAVGIDVDGGSATITNNHIYDNTIGVRVQNGGTASLDDNDFSDATDNDTDLQLTNAPGAVTVGGTTANAFAGDLFFIDDLSTQNIDASNNTFDEASNFRIEDKMHHRVDTDLAATDGLVSWVAGNLYVTNAGTDHSIQRGVDAAGSGNTINLETGTFDQVTNVNKAVTITGAGQSPIVTRNAGPSNQKLFSIAAQNVTITDLTMHVNRPFAVAGVYADTGVTGNFNGLTVSNSLIRSFGSGGLLTGSLGGPTSAAGVALLGTSAQSATIGNNNVKADNDITPTSVFGRGIWLGGITATVQNNPVVAGLAQDLLLSAMASGTTTVSGNSFFGAGVDASQPASGAVINISTNTFSPASPLFPQSMIVKANTDGTVNVTNNIFSGHNNVGVFVGASKNVLVKDNAFTPNASSSNYSHVVVSTGYPTNSGFVNVPDQSVTIQGNNFNGAGGATGRALDFQNVNSAVGNGMASVTLGGAGALANKYQANLTEFMRLTPTFSAPHPAAGTTAYTPAPFAFNLDATNETFDVGSGLQTPGAMSVAGLGTLETKIYHKIDNAAVGLVNFSGTNIYVTPAAVPTPTDNDYTRIANAVAAAGAGYTINLTGVFDWTEANAALSWSKGNDGLIGTTADNYTLTIPANLNNVTFTAPGGLGTAEIKGPGDIATENLEGVFVFDGGDNKNWTISNLRIVDFDLAIGFFNGAGGSDAFDNTTITNNYIRVATDLNATAAPADVNQNIGIHYSFGKNQTISNNTIEFAGTGTSNAGGSVFATSVGMQSNTSGGDVYDGLQITGNILNVTGAQSADPEVILGIWENAHAHLSDITVSGNQFNNLSGSNNPVANLQRAFRVTSHSGASSTVTYSGNTVGGANIGFQWLAGSNFSGNQPVQLINNDLTNVNTGVLVQSSGSAHLSDNTLANSGSMLLVGTGLSVAAGSSAVIDDATANNEISGFATGISGAGSITVTGNDASIHGNTVGIDVNGGSATITGNHIYNNTIGVRVRSAGTASLDDNDFDGGGNPDNGTDVQLISSPGVVTVGGTTANDFAGDTFYIDNQSTQNINAANNNFDVASNFDIEDLMHHRMDTDLLVGNGLITWVAGNLYVTDAGTDHSIQRGIDSASTGNTVNVEAGTYSENSVLNKVLTLKGAQSGVDARGRVASETTLTPAIAANTTLELTTGSGASVIDGFTFSGGTALGMIRSVASAVNNNLQIVNNRFSGFTGGAIFLDKPGDDVTIDKNEVDGSSKITTGGLVHLDTDTFNGFYLTNNWILNGVTGPGWFVDGARNVGPSGSRNPLISGNRFNNNDVGANIGSRALQSATISLNQFNNNDFDGLQGGPKDSFIIQNTFDGNDRWGVALTSFGNMTAGRGAINNSVTNNFFLNNNFMVTSGDVLVSATQPAGNAASNAINYNSLTSTVGISYSGTETINGDYNWWNHGTGPSGGGHSGTGSAVAGTGAAFIDVNPWVCVGTDVGGNPNDGFQPDLTQLCVDGLSINGLAVTNEGSLYTLNYVNNGDVDFAGVDTWNIDWGDGDTDVFVVSPGSSGSFTHTYDDGLNNWVISATAEDNTNTYEIEATVAVTVNNVDPTAALGNGGAVSEGSTGSVSFSGQFDPSVPDTTAGFHYAYDFDNNGTFEIGDGSYGGSGTSSSAVVPASYLDDGNGNRTVKARIIDKDGGFNDYTTSITINNVAPVGTLGNGGPVNEGSTGAVNFSAQFDPSTADTTAGFHYAYDFNNDGTFEVGDGSYGGSGTSSSAVVPASFLADGPFVRTVKARIIDKDGGFTDYTTNITVNNVAPTIAVSGLASVNEGSVYTLSLGAITDPGVDTVYRYIINWDDGSFTDITANPTGTNHNHTYTDGTITRNITISLFDEDTPIPHLNAGNPNPFPVQVLNVDPTATFFNGGAVNEGSGGLVGFTGEFDPSGPDTTAGFSYSYDFNNDNIFEIVDSPLNSATVPASYLADGPGSRTVQGRIKDKDGGFTDYTTTITINNVTPVVNGGPNGVIGATQTFTQNGNFTDPGADSPWVGKVDYDLQFGDSFATADPLTLTGFNFTLSHQYNTPGVYTIRVYVQDKDGAIGTDDVQVTVGAAPTFRVNTLTFNASGFTANFNRAADTSVLNIYDGLDGITPSAEVTDITLVGNVVGAVRGSAVWDAATNTLRFIKTGGILASDTYTVTLRSSSSGFKDTGGALLDGDSNGTAGDNYSQNFVFSASAGRVLSIPDFTRGPDAANNINLPNTGTLGVPVRISDGDLVRSVDFTLTYDPTLLSITNVQKATGMPADWSVTFNNTTPGTLHVTVFGTTTDLSAGAQNIIKITANVPNTAAYQAAQALVISGITVSKNDATTLASVGDVAVHKAMYFGDADADRIYTGFDAGLISRVVVNLDNGFHESPLVDPVIVADIDGSGGLSGIDASFVSQKSVALPRPEIPDLPGVLPPLVGGGIDPNISGDTGQVGAPGDVLNIPLSIDDATGLLGFNVTVTYEDLQLLIENADITLGTLLDGAGDWNMTVNALTAGEVKLSFFRSNGQPMTGGTGEIANLAVHILPTAVSGHEILDATGPSPVGGLAYNYFDGSLDIDADGPAIPTGNFFVDTVPTAPMELQFQFSEDVSASLDGSDIQLTNLTTSTVINPSFIVMSNYNSFTNVATFVFDPAYVSGILPDGDYEAVINSAGVTDALGNPMPGNAICNFFVLAGDANRDRTVDTVDFNILAANFSDPGMLFTDGDFDYSGSIDTIDFNIFAANFSASLPAPAARSAVPASAGGKSLFSGTPIVKDDSDIIEGAGLG